MSNLSKQLERIDLSQQLKKEWWMDEGGFFGRKYIEGDDSLEGYLSTPKNLQERTNQEVEGVIRLLNLQEKQSVLDCPCGYGRHSIVLAKHGFEVVGIDINSQEIEIAHCQADGLENLQFVKQDMRYLKLNSELDAVVNMFYSFGFFETEAENLQVLQNFYNALKPGGKFLMHTDVNIPRILSGKYKFAEARQLQNDRKLEILESYDPIDKRMKGQWSFINSDGTREETTPYSVRVYSFREFSSLCQSVGFQNIRGYGGWDGSQLTNDSEDMMVVAEK